MVKKKMKLIISSMFKKRETEQPRTLKDMFKNGAETPEESSWFTSSPESGSFSTEESEGEWLETVMRSERLFFEPGRSSSILEDKKSNINGSPPLLFKESVVLAVESRDPYGDFRRSMEEMVRIHGLDDWECLLRCYLKVNGKKNHGLIVGAFVDLLLDLASSPPPPLHVSCSDSALFQDKDEEQG